MLASTIPESHRDLVERCPTVILATLGPDGFPQVSAMWFLVEEDGTIAASLNTARQKVKNLRRSPDATLFFVDPDNPYRTLEIRARADLTPDPDYTFADQVGGKYGVNLREMDKPGQERVVARFAPVKVNTYG
ncbi:MAG TPA: PPOX class F420-dependent oxidoreductase [Thermomicrobiales bacterium]|jgi:PPOX class probable F420-dependent enzyme|nr:PPOX class F420-dependent oxidoreductase [Thermomicrobiales bacterium]